MPPPFLYYAPNLVFLKTARVSPDTLAFVAFWQGGRQVTVVRVSPDTLP